MYTHLVGGKLLEFWRLLVDLKLSSYIRIVPYGTHC